MKPQALRFQPWVLGALSCAGLMALSGCNAPEREDPAVQLPPREPDAVPIVRNEPVYQRELAPCEADALGARECFESAYRRAGAPRLTFVANTAPSIVADTRPPPSNVQVGADSQGSSPQVEMKDSPNAVIVTTGQGPREEQQGEPIAATSDAVGLAGAERMAVPVDRASVEDHLVDVFTSFDPEVQIIHLGVAREQLEREIRTVGYERYESFVNAMRDRNLADVAVMFDVRVTRHGTPSKQDVSVRAQVDALGRTVASSAEGSTSTSSVMSIALTGRAVRVNDGSVIAAVTPPRSEVIGEVALGDALRNACECAAAALAMKMCPRLGDATGRTTLATVRVLSAPNNEYVFEFMRWIEAEFPGSRAVFRSFSAGQGEFSVELKGGIGDLIQRAAKQTRLPDLRLDSARTSENTVTFVANSK